VKIIYFQRYVEKYQRNSEESQKKIIIILLSFILFYIILNMSVNREIFQFPNQN